MEFVTPDLGTIFWMVIIFGVTLFILKKFAWKPILHGLKTREESIADALSSAEKAREEMKNLKAGNEKILAEAKREREAILREAVELKNKLITEAKQQAADEGQKMINNAKSQIEAEKNAAVEDFRRQVVDLSVEIAGKVLRKELENESKQKELVQDMLSDFKFGNN